MFKMVSVVLLWPLPNSGTADRRSGCGAKVVNFWGFVKRLRGLFTRGVEETQGITGEPILLKRREIAMSALP